MENDIFKKLCGQVTFSTYKNLAYSLGVSSVGLYALNNLFLSQYPILYSSVSGAWLISEFIFLILIYSGGENYTKDVVQIKELYKEFLKNYSKLNLLFDLNNPIEIQTMFSYLLYKGYLSKDKTFSFDKKGSKEIRSLMGANIMNGTGVCRHIACMLTDILKNQGIEAMNLSLRNKPVKLNIEFLDKTIHTKEELINWIRRYVIDDESRDLLMSYVETSCLLEIYPEFSLLEQEEQNIKKVATANHLITFAHVDNKNYYLDPTQLRIYRMSETNNDILYDDFSKNTIHLNQAFLMNDTKSCKKLKERLKGEFPSVSRDEEDKMVLDTLDICDSNTDLFEVFYLRNHELYQEISSKVLSLKKGFLCRK